MDNTKEIKTFYVYTYSSKNNEMTICYYEMQKYSDWEWYDGVRTYLSIYDLGYLKLETWKDGFTIEMWSDKPDEKTFAEDVKEMLINLQKGFSEVLYELHDVKIRGVK